MNEQGEWQFESPLPSGPKQKMIGIGDLDGDGRPEIILADKNHVVLWGDGKPKANLGTPLQAQLTDMDGDGQQEIVTLKREGSFARLLVWKFDRSRKRLGSFASSTFEAIVTVVVNGQTFPVKRDSLLVSDLEGDGFKEIIVYAGMDYWLDLFYASSFSVYASSLFVQLRQLHFLLSSRTSPSKIHPSPLPSSRPHTVRFSASTPLWLLFRWDGKRIAEQKLKPPKEIHRPVTPINMGTQTLLVTEGWKYIRRFQPRLHSFNPLYLTWWEEGAGRQGELWQVSEETKSNSLRFRKVADLHGKTGIVADLNGDKLPEIVWVREIVGTSPQPSTVMGVNSWKLGRWRKGAWVLTQQTRHQSVSHIGALITVAIPTPSFSPIKILPIKVDKGFDLLIASPDGTIERVRIR